MKNKVTPTDVERVMKDDEFIITKTNPKGLITYANQTFIDYSGFSEKELLGKQHNIIRHPDMPRAVFKLLWDTIQSGEEFNGYVKNLSKDGSFYWVQANVTPSYDASGNLLGYYSVRRKPSASSLDKIKPLYKLMLHAERGAGARDAIVASTEILEELLSDQRLKYDEYVLAL